MSKWIFRVVVVAFCAVALAGILGRFEAVFGWGIAVYLAFHARLGVWADLKRLWSVGKRTKVGRGFASMRGGAL